VPAEQPRAQVRLDGRGDRGRRGAGQAVADEREAVLARAERHAAQHRDPLAALAPQGAERSSSGGAEQLGRKPGRGRRVVVRRRPAGQDGDARGRRARGLLAPAVDRGG
jgi:hypothetical protein